MTINANKWYFSCLTHVKSCSAFVYFLRWGCFIRVLGSRGVSFKFFVVGGDIEVFMDGGILSGIFVDSKKIEEEFGVMETLKIKT